MLGLLSLASVIAGSGLAFGTKWFPSRVETMETFAGAFLLLGFGLLGSALQQEMFFISSLARSL
jgi:hypothetical protein